MLRDTARLEGKGTEKASEFESVVRVIERVIRFKALIYIYIYHNVTKSNII